MNSTGRIDFASRLSVRAITAGSFVAFSGTILLMTIAAAFGVWNFNVAEVSNLGATFWLWGFGAWIASVFVGAYLAAVASRSMTRRDGLIHGFTLWAVTCALGCLGIAIGTGRIFNFMAEGASRGMHWGAFVGDALGLIAALYGGVLGARSEAKSVATEARQPEAEVQRIPRAAG